MMSIMRYYQSALQTLARVADGSCRTCILMLEDQSRRSYIMKLLQFLVNLILVLAFSLPAYANKAKSAYNRGVKAEAQNNYDAAYEAYMKAYTIKPKDPNYLVAYLRLRSYAALQHVQRRQLLRDGGKLPQALAEFQRAVEIDPSNLFTQQEARRTADMIGKQARHEVTSATPQSPLAKMAEEAEGPVELEIAKKSPITLRISATADHAYQIIGKVAGINVMFDPDYKPHRISIELNEVTPHEALEMMALESKTFWQPISTNTILVAADTAGKRKEFEDNVMKTFYLRNVATQAELQEAANTLKGILDVTRIQLIPTQSAIVLR